MYTVQRCPRVIGVEAMRLSKGSFHFFTTLSRSVCAVSPSLALALPSYAQLSIRITRKLKDECQKKKPPLLSDLCGFCRIIPPSPENIVVLNLCGLLDNVLFEDWTVWICLIYLRPECCWSAVALLMLSQPSETIPFETAGTLWKHRVYRLV